MTTAAIVKEQGNKKQCVCLFIATTILWSRFIAWLKEVKNSIRQNVNPAQQCSVTFQRTVWDKMKLAAVDPLLRPHGHWDRLFSIIISIFLLNMIYRKKRRYNYTNSYTYNYTYNCPFFILRTELNFYSMQTKFCRRRPHHVKDWAGLFYRKLFPVRKVFEVWSEPFTSTKLRISKPCLYFRIYPHGLALSHILFTLYKYHKTIHFHKCFRDFCRTRDNSKSLFKCLRPFYSVFLTAIFSDPWPRKKTKHWSRTLHT
jgi:hypothetical protein